MKREKREKKKEELKTVFKSQEFIVPGGEFENTLGLEEIHLSEFAGVFSIYV